MVNSAFGTWVLCLVVLLTISSCSGSEVDDSLAQCIPALLPCVRALRALQAECPLDDPLLTCKKPADELNVCYSNGVRARSNQPATSLELWSTTIFKPDGSPCYSHSWDHIRLADGTDTDLEIALIADLQTGETVLQYSQTPEFTTKFNCHGAEAILPVGDRSCGNLEMPYDAWSDRCAVGECKVQATKK